MNAEEYFAVWKQSRSKPTDEDSIIFHLANHGEQTLCKIENRYPDVYNFGFAPLINIKPQKIQICKNCFKHWIKEQEEQL